MKLSQNYTWEFKQDRKHTSKNRFFSFYVGPWDGTDLAELGQVIFFNTYPYCKQWRIYFVQNYESKQGVRTVIRVPIEKRKCPERVCREQT